MGYIMDGIVEAFRLLFSFDPEIYEVIGLSVVVSLVATLLSSIIGIVFGVVLGVKSFPFKKWIININYAFMGLPPIVVGLFVLLVISNKGPMGRFELLFTPIAMIIAQFFLVTPIISALVYGTVKNNGIRIIELCRTLGGTPIDVLILLLKELKQTILIAITTGFGRAISEVGAVMIVGGNIKHSTRVMTTYIALNNSMGDYSKSIAMGIVLLLLAVFVNTFVHKMAEE